MDSGFTGQWAILPARVRYDRTLPANAKLIYAEIAAKINEEGYCFCYNQYFADRFGLTVLMVTHSMKQALTFGTRTLMLHEGRIIFDVSEPERAGLTVTDLIDQFKKARGEEISDDRLLAG